MTMDQFSKEGRKLRPRKAAGTAAHTERVEYRPGENKSYGEHRSSGEHRSYGSKPYGSRPQRSNGDRQQRPYGEHKPYGEHRSNFSSNPEGGERKSYGDRQQRPYGEHKSYGEHKPYGERKSYGERRSNFNSSPEGGERKSYGDRPYGERKSFSGDRRKPGFNAGRPGPKRGPKPVFNRTDEGINRMISRRPVVNGAELSDFDAVPSEIKGEIRLNKFIANSGVCSRREADTLIQAGVVTVNGEVVTELGTKVNLYEDDIRFNGERLKGEEKVYIIMNKPKGFVTTASDPHAERTVMDLLKGCQTRVYPVGRLDKNTTGVLMFTNDGEMAERLTHPAYDKKKIYQVSLDRNLSQEDYDKILEGITLTDGDIKADELEYIDEHDHRKLGIEIHSGKNRIVRRIFESMGYTVKALDRVYFAGLTKKGLKKGEWRYLTEGEANILKMGAYI